MGKKIRTLFMGTPEFSVFPLDAIYNEGIEIAGVITAPDKPAGRGKKIQYSAVKQYALEKNLTPILQPTNLKDPGFITDLKNLCADLFVVIAFRMLPEVVWSMPKLGTINLHASLLPQYRGAAPINWAIINGEKQTGVTTFFIEKEIDTGNIIMQEAVDIEENDNAGTLHDKLKVTGAEIIIKTIRTIADGAYVATPQGSLKIQDKLSPAPKIYKEDCKINWDQPAKKILNFIRGLSPYPTAWTEIKGEKVNPLSLKIFEAETAEIAENKKPGSISFSNNSFTIACKNSSLKIKSLQLAGKKRLDTEAFLRGFSEKELYSSVS